MPTLSIATQINSLSPLSPAKRALFKPYGELIGIDESTTHYPINHGTTTRYHALAQASIDTHANAILSIFHTKGQTLPLQLVEMERHPLGSQAFVPLSPSLRSRYLVVVAPAGSADIERIQSELAVFIVHIEPNTKVGVNYAPGVWHHPLIALDHNQDFLVMDRKGLGNNCDVLTLPDHWIITP